MANRVLNILQHMGALAFEEAGRVAFPVFAVGPGFVEGARLCRAGCLIEPHVAIGGSEHGVEGEEEGVVNAGRLHR